MTGRVINMNVKEERGRDRPKKRWIYLFIYDRYTEEEHDAPAVNALGVRLRKLSNVLKGQS
jgi:hypothetical protein